MQKILAMLEQNVQWLVLGLGGLYLLWMLWVHVLQPPVTVEVGGQTVIPGKVDDVVKEKAAMLEAAINRPPPNIVFPKIDAAEQFLAAIHAPPQPKPLTALAFAAPTGKLDAEPKDPSSADPGGAVAGPVRIMNVETLPSLPAPVDLVTRRGRSTALVPDPAGVVDQAFAALGPVKNVDEDWVTVRFTVKKDALASAYSEVKIPDNLTKKLLFLQAELIREELMPDGSWGNQKVIPLVKGSKAWPFPAGNDRNATSPYLDWARGNQPEIMQPLFYTVAKGDRWGAPGMEDKEQAALQPVMFDVNIWIDAPDISSLTPDQRKQVMDARSKRAAEVARQRREQNQGRQRGTGGEFDPGSGTGRRGGQGPGGGGPPGNFQDRSQGFQPGGFPPIPPPGSEFFPGASDMPGMQQQQQPAVNNVNLQSEFPLPNGEFDPRDPLMKDITGWIHDATVEAGKTYRYKVRYKMKNPVYQTNVAKNPADSAQFVIASADSAWTESVTIPELTSFYVASNFDPRNARNVKFEVFKFQDGVLHKETFNAGPGDVIGQVEKDINFNTGWTVVDLRETGTRLNPAYVVITDSSGRLQQRYYISDRDDPEAAKLRAQYAQQQQAAPAGG